MSLLNLISSNNFITVNKTVSRKIGLQASVFFSELIYKHQYWNDRGELLDGKWFFYTVEDAEEATTLKRKSQEAAVKILVQHNLIECARKGIPSKRYFALNIDEIYQFVLDVRVEPDKNGQNGRTDDNAGSEHLNCTEKPEKPRHNQNGRNGRTVTDENTEQERCKYTPNTPNLSLIHI